MRTPISVTSWQRSKLIVIWGFAEGDLDSSPPDTDALIALFQDLEFKTWLDALLASDGKADGDVVSDGAETSEAVSASDAIEVATIFNQSDFDEWLAKLKSASLFAFDTETTSLDYMVAEVVGVSFAVASGAAAYVPLAHDYPGAPDQLDRDAVLEALRPLLEDERIAKVRAAPQVRRQCPG